MTMAVLAMATFAVLDNVFLSVAGHQPAKLDGFRASHLTSMREYISNSLEATAPGVAVFLALGGPGRRHASRRSSSVQAMTYTMATNSHITPKPGQGARVCAAW